MKKILLTIVCTLMSLALYAQTGGMKGTVVSRDGRTPIYGVNITVDGVDTGVVTDHDGAFEIAGLAPGQYKVHFTAAEFEDLDLMVRVYELVHDMQQVVMIPMSIVAVDDSAFAELDTDVESAGDSQGEQIRIAKEVLHSTRHNEDVRKLVKGLMIESYIEDGCQKADGGVYGKSITDPCLGWEKTEKLIMEIAELRKR